jgi:hypothetical protein
LWNATGGRPIAAQDVDGPGVARAVGGETVIRARR